MPWTSPSKLKIHDRRLKRARPLTRSPSPTMAARPKRAAENFARQQEATSKKPRFDHRNPSTLAADAPEEDLILDADVIGRSGAQTKRNAVNIDGYESDSDDDNFDARAAQRERAPQGRDLAPSKDEEQDDMFADLEEGMQGTADGDDDEDVRRQGKKAKKDVRFLDQAEIQGQVLNSRSGGHVGAVYDADGTAGPRAASVESSSSSGSDEERALLPEEMEEDLAAEIGAGGKKKHAPRLDAFNLKNEAEEGQYDQSGNFVRKAADPDAVNDSWLEGLSKKDMKRAREAQEKRDDEKKRKAAEDDAMLTSDLLATLISLLEIGETALEALQRLNKAKSKPARVPGWKQKRQQKQNDEMELDKPGDKDAPEDPAERARRTAIEAITGAADALYSREQHDVYDTEREMLMRQYKRDTGEDWQAAAAEARDGESREEATSQPANGQDGASRDIAGTAAAQWEYRWSDARDGGALHGPYDAHTMSAWQTAGYFGEGVEFRRVGDGDRGWTRVLDVP
nr:lin1-like protein [Quercus suber]